MNRIRQHWREEREANTPAWYSIWYLRWGQGGGRNSQPQDPNIKGSSQPTAHLPTSLTIGTAEHDLGTCSGKTGAQTEAKTRQMETVEPQSYFSSHSPSPAPLTHKSLVDKVFCKVDQHQRDDVPQEALEGQEM